MITRPLIRPSSKISTMSQRRMMRRRRSNSRRRRQSRRQHGNPMNIFLRLLNAQDRQALHQDRVILSNDNRATMGSFMFTIVPTTTRQVKHNQVHHNVHPRNRMIINRRTRLNHHRDRQIRGQLIRNFTLNRRRHILRPLRAQPTGTIMKIISRRQGTSGHRILLVNNIRRLLNRLSIALINLRSFTHVTTRITRLRRQSRPQGGRRTSSARGASHRSSTRAHRASFSFVGTGVIGWSEVSPVES